MALICVLNFLLQDKVLHLPENLPSSTPSKSTTKSPQSKKKQPSFMILLGSVCDPKLDLLSTYLFGLLSTRLHIGVMLFPSFHIYSISSTLTFCDNCIFADC